MKDNYILKALILVSVLCGMYLLLYTRSDTTHNQKVTVGVIGPFAGELAFMGESLQNALQLAEPQNVEFIFQDDQCDPKKALSAYNLLIGQNVEVFYVACSGSVLALAPLAKQQNHIILTAYAGSIDIRKTGSEVIRFVPDGISIANALTGFLSEDTNKHYGILYEQQDYAHSVAHKLQEDLGEQITLFEGYQADETSFKTSLIKFNTESIDSIIIIPVADTALQIIYKEIQELGIRKPIIGEVNMCDYAFTPSDYGLSGVCFKSELTTNGYIDFIKSYKDTYDREPEFPFYDAVSFDLIKIVDDLVTTLSDSENIVSSLKKEILKGQKGYVAEYIFTENGEVFGGDYLKKVSF